MILFGTSACHLCEQAEALLLASLAPGTYYLRNVDVADNPRLMDQYGVFIPVLEWEEAKKSLYWPFDREKLLAFLSTPNP